MKRKFQWVKRGLIFDPSDRTDWMQKYAQVPTVLELESKTRIFFTTRGSQDDNGQYKSQIGFADFEKNSLQKILEVSAEPIIELGKPGTFDEFGMMPGCIVQKEGLHYMYYTGWSRGVGVPFTTSIGVLVSDDDGVSWKRQGDGPVLGRTLNEPYLENGPYVLMRNDTWHMWYASGIDWMWSGEKYEAVYVTKYAHSKDGVNWCRSGEPCFDNVLQNESNGRPTVIELDGVYHMWFCYRESLGFRQKTGGYKIGYAHSNDMVSWIRQDELSGINLGDSGWDSEMQAYPQVIKNNNSISLFYNGNFFGMEGFGFATMELS